MKTALFPGSFDPITLGHADIITRTSGLFDRIIIGIGNNTSKQYMFSLKQRTEWIRKCFEQNPKVEVHSYSGLTVEFCKKMNALYIIRGLRSSSDFQYEQNIAQMNKSLAPEIETVFIPCRPAYTAITSTIVRDIIRNNGSIVSFVPDCVVL